MAAKLAKHATEAGYKAELKTDNVCEKCRTAHRIYNRQFTKGYKARGIKYGSHDVLTSDQPARARPGRSGAGQGHAPVRPQAAPPEATGDGSAGLGGPGEERGPGRLGELGDRLSRLVMPGESQEYVENSDPPEYLHPITPDEDPEDSDWARVGDEEFVINAAGMRKIEENMGTYLSIVGMTAEMIDPYCGSALATNFDNIVSKWSKVVALYPPAAKLFLDSKGGVIFTCIAALQATWPVLYAMFEHHLAHTVITEKGIAYRKTQNGQAPIDPTMPPMRDEYDYTVS